MLPKISKKILGFSAIAAGVFAFVLSCENPFKAGLGPKVDIVPPVIHWFIPDVEEDFLRWEPNTEQILFKVNVTDDLAVSHVEIYFWRLGDREEDVKPIVMINSLAARDVPEVDKHKDVWAYYLVGEADGELLCKIIAYDKQGKTDSKKMTYTIKNKEPAISVSYPYMENEFWLTTPIAGNKYDWDAGKTQKPSVYTRDSLRGMVVDAQGIQARNPQIRFLKPYEAEPTDPEAGWVSMDEYTGLPSRFDWKTEDPLNQDLQRIKNIGFEYSLYERDANGNKLSSPLDPSDNPYKFRIRAWDTGALERDKDGAPLQITNAKLSVFPPLDKPPAELFITADAGAPKLDLYFNRDLALKGADPLVEGDGDDIKVVQVSPAYNIHKETDNPAFAPFNPKSPYAQEATTRQKYASADFVIEARVRYTRPIIKAFLAVRDNSDGKEYYLKLGQGLSAAYNTTDYAGSPQADPRWMLSNKGVYEREYLFLSDPIGNGKKIIIIDPKTGAETGETFTFAEAEYELSVRVLDQGVEDIPANYTEKSVMVRIAVTPPEVVIVSVSPNTEENLAVTPAKYTVNGHINVNWLADAGYTGFETDESGAQLRKYVVSGTPLTEDYEEILDRSDAKIARGSPIRFNTLVEDSDGFGSRLYAPDVSSPNPPQPRTYYFYIAAKDKAGLIGGAYCEITVDQTKDFPVIAPERPEDFSANEEIQMTNNNGSITIRNSDATPSSITVSGLKIAKNSMGSGAAIVATLSDDDGLDTTGTVYKLFRKDDTEISRNPILPTGAARVRSGKINDDLSDLDDGFYYFTLSTRDSGYKDASDIGYKNKDTADIPFDPPHDSRTVNLGNYNSTGQVWFVLDTQPPKVKAGSASINSNTDIGDDYRENQINYKTPPFPLYVGASDTGGLSSIIVLQRRLDITSTWMKIEQIDLSARSYTPSTSTTEHWLVEHIGNLPRDTVNTQNMAANTDGRYEYTVVVVDQVGQRAEAKYIFMQDSENPIIRTIDYNDNYLSSSNGFTIAGQMRDRGGNYPASVVGLSEITNVYWTLTSTMITPILTPAMITDRNNPSAWTASPAAWRRGTSGEDEWSVTVSKSEITSFLGSTGEGRFWLHVVARDNAGNLSTTTKSPDGVAKANWPIGSANATSATPEIGKVEIYIDSRNPEIGWDGYTFNPATSDYPAGNSLNVSAGSFSGTTVQNSGGIWYAQGAFNLTFTAMDGFALHSVKIERTTKDGNDSTFANIPLSGVNVTSGGYFNGSSTHTTQSGYIDTLSATFPDGSTGTSLSSPSNSSPTRVTDVKVILNQPFTAGNDDGDYRYRITVTDFVGKVREYPVFTVRVDSRNPVVRSITAPASVGSNFTVSGEARDPNDRSAITHLYYAVTSTSTPPALNVNTDNAPTGADWKSGSGGLLANGNWSWQANVTGVNTANEGMQFFHAAVRDTSGRISAVVGGVNGSANNWPGTTNNESTWIGDPPNNPQRGMARIYVDHSNPVITMNSADGLNNQSGVNVSSINQNGVYYTNKNFSITFTASDTYALRDVKVMRSGNATPLSLNNYYPHSNVELAGGGTGSSLSDPVNSSPVTNLQNTFTETVGNSSGQLADGTYTYTITVTDFVGKETVTTFTVIVDTKPPVISAIATTNAFITGSSFTATGTVRDQTPPVTNPVTPVTPITAIYWKIGNESTITGVSGVYANEAAYLDDITHATSSTWTNIPYGGTPDWTAAISGIDTYTEGSVYLYMAARDAAGNISHPMTTIPAPEGSNNWAGATPIAQIGKMPIYIDKNNPDMAWDSSWAPGGVNDILALTSGQKNMDTMFADSDPDKNPFTGSANAVRKFANDTNYYTRGNFKINFTAVDTFALRTVTVTRIFNNAGTNRPLTSDAAVKLYAPDGAYTTTWLTPNVSPPGGGAAVPSLSDPANVSAPKKIIAANIVLTENLTTEGAYTYRITVTDFVGKTLTYPEFRVIVDRTAPVVTITETTAASAGPTLVGGQPLYTVNGVFRFAATRNDGSGGSGVVETKWWLVNRTSTSPTTDPDGAPDWDGAFTGTRTVYDSGTVDGNDNLSEQIDTRRATTPIIPDGGDYTLYIMAQDKAGNTNVVVKRYIKVDQETDKPGITITSPVNGSYTSTATLAGTLTDDDNVGSYKVDYSTDGGVTWVTMVNTVNTSLLKSVPFTVQITSATPGFSTDGLKTLRITAYDDRSATSQIGNDVNPARQQNKEVILTFTWDQTPPEMVWDRGWTPAISGEAISNLPTTGAAGQTNLDAMSGSPGSSTHPFTGAAVVKKPAGEMNFYTKGDFTINFAAMDKIALRSVEVTVRGSSGGFGSNLLTSAMFTTLYDSAGNTPSYATHTVDGVVSLSDPEGKTGPKISILAAKIALPQNNLFTGSYTYRITVTDFVGHRTQYDDFTIIVDKTLPTVDIVNVTAASTGPTQVDGQPLYTVNGVFSFNATAIDTYGLEGTKWWLIKRINAATDSDPAWSTATTSVTLETGRAVYAGGLTLSAEIDTVGAGKWIPDFAAGDWTSDTRDIPDGDYTLYVMARDRAENDKLEKRFIYVHQETDNPTPEITSPDPENHTYTSGAVILRGTLTDDDNVASYTIQYSTNGGGAWNNVTSYTNVPVSPPRKDVTLNVNLSDVAPFNGDDGNGTYMLRVRVTDDFVTKLGADKTGSRAITIDSDPITFTRDNRKPMFTNVDPAPGSNPIPVYKDAPEITGTLIEVNLDDLGIPHNAATPRIKWTLDDGGTGMEGYITLSGNSPYNWTLADPAFITAFGNSSLLQGTHTLRIEALDKAGQTGSAQITFIKDTTAPEIAFNNINLVQIDGDVPNDLKTKLSGVTKITDGTSTIRLTLSDTYSPIGANQTGSPGQYYFEYRIYKWENRSAATFIPFTLGTTVTEKSLTRDIPLTGSGINGDGIYWLDVQVKDRLGNGTSSVAPNTSGGIVENVVFILDSNAPELVWDRSWTAGDSIPASGSDELDLEKMSLSTTASSKNPFAVTVAGVDTVTARKPNGEINYYTQGNFTVNVTAVDSFALRSVKVERRDPGSTAFNDQISTPSLGTVAVTRYDSAGNSLPGYTAYNVDTGENSLSDPGGVAAASPIRILAAKIVLSQTPAPAGGSYTYRITVTDFVGQRTQYPDFTIIVDRENPGVTITNTTAAKVANNKFSGNPTPNGSRSLYTVNGVFQFTANSSDQFGLVGSKWWLLNGNTSTASGNAAMLVDDDASFTPAYDFTAADMITAGYTVYAGGGGDGVSSLAGNDTLIDTIDPNPGYPVIPTNPGHYTLYIIAQDKAGRETVIKHYIYVDQATDIPEVVTTSPTPNSFRAAGDITLQGTVTDDDGIGEIRIQYYNGTTWANVQAPITFNSITGFPKEEVLAVDLDASYFESDGEKQVRITVLDAPDSKLGNDTGRQAKTKEHIIIFTRDTTSPVISVTPDLTEYIYREEFTLEGEVAEAYPQDINRIKWTLNDGTAVGLVAMTGYVNLTGAATPYSWELTIPQNVFNALGEGINNLRIETQDKAGNNGSKQLTLIRDTQGPVISLNPPLMAQVYGTKSSGGVVTIADSSNIINSSAITLSGTFIDLYSPIYRTPGNETFFYKVDGNKVVGTNNDYKNDIVNQGWLQGTLTTDPNSKSLVWTIDLPSADNNPDPNKKTEDGDYLLSIRIKDSLGNGYGENDAPAGNSGPGFLNNLAFVIDRGIPILNVDPLASLYQSGNVVITGTITNTKAIQRLSAAQGDEELAYAGLEVASPLHTVLNSNASTKTHTFTITLPGSTLDEGSYSLAISAKGGSGHTAMKVVIFIYDTTPPAVDFAIPAAGTQTGSGAWNPVTQSKGNYRVISSGKWVTGSPSISGTTSDTNGIKDISFHLGELHETSGTLNTVYNAAANWTPTGLGTDSTDDDDSKWSGGLYYWTFQTALNGYLNQTTLIDTNTGKGGNYFYIPLYVKVTDQAGNIAIAKYNIWVDPDADMPNATIITPANNNDVGGDNVRISGTANDDNMVYRVEIRIKPSLQTGDGVDDSALQAKLDVNGYYKDSVDDWLYPGATDPKDRGWIKATIPMNDLFVSWYYISNKDSSLSPVTPIPRPVTIEVRALDTKGTPEPGDTGDLWPLNPALDLKGEPDLITVNFAAGVPEISTPVILKANDEIYGGANGKEFVYGDKISGVFTIKTTVRDDGGISSLKARVSNGGGYIEIIKDGAIRNDTTTVPPNSLGGTSGVTWSIPTIRPTDQTLTTVGWRYQLTAINNGYNEVDSRWNDIDYDYVTGKKYVPGTWVKLKAADANLRGYRANIGSQASGENDTNWNLQFFEYGLEFTVNTINNPSLTYGNAGNFTLDLQVFDNNQIPTPYNANGSYTIGIDNVYPEAAILTQYNAVTANFYVTGTAKDFGTTPAAIQGLKRMLVYFERNGVYYNAAGNTITTGMTTRANIRDATVNLDANGNGNLYTGPTPNAPNTFRFPVLSQDGKTSAHAMVIDEQELFENSDFDGDGTFAEQWQRDGAGMLWQARLDTTALTATIRDGPLTVHYIIMDEVGNATHYRYNIYVGNNRPWIRTITLGTDLNVNGTVGDAGLGEYDNPINVGDTPAGNRVITTDFRVRNSRFGLKLETLYGNGQTVGVSQKRYNVYYVERQPGLIEATAMERGKVYTISNNGGNTEWERYGALNNSEGTTFVATGPARATTNTGLVYGYTNSVAATQLTGPFGDNVHDITVTFGQGHFRRDDTNNLIPDSYMPPDPPDPANPPLQHDRFFIIKVYDTTVSGGSEAEQLAHVALINVDINNVDEVDPHISLAPFEEEFVLRAASPANPYPTMASNADRVLGPVSAYTRNVVTTGANGTGTKKGYVQYAVHDTANRASVSGMVIFRGKAADNNRISKISASILNYNGGASFDIATYDPGTNTLVPATGTNTITNMRSSDTIARGFEPEEHSLTLAYSHVVNWSFAWDTSTITNTARNDVLITFVVTDARGNESATTTMVNVVPYITEVVTSLPSNFDRSAANGWYPVREGEVIDIKGFNLNNATTGVTLNSVRVGAAAGGTNSNALTGLTVVGGKTKTHIRGTVPPAAVSGELVVTVNNVPSLNNRNNNDANYVDATTPLDKMYNREPNGVTSNILTDDRGLYVWNTGLLANAPNMAGPIMRMTPNATRYTTFGAYHGTSTGNYNGQLKLIVNNTNLSSSNESVGQTNETTTPAGVSSVMWNTNRFIGTANSLGITADGQWAVTGTNQTSTGASFNFAYNFYGTSANLGRTSNEGQVPGARRHLVNIGQDVNRIRFPRIAMQNTGTNGTDPTAPQVRTVLAYYHAPSANIYLNYGYIRGTSNADTVYTVGTTEAAANRSFANVTPDQAAGGSTPSDFLRVATGSSTYASGQYVAAGLLNNGRAVIAWYDQVNRNLCLSYDSHSPGLATVSNPTRTTTSMTSVWQANASVIADTDYAGNHVDMAVDAANGVHLAYVDVRNGGLWYTYVPPTGSGNAAYPNAAAAETVRVDTYLSVGTKLMINVRTEGSRYVPYITYIHNAFAETTNSVRVAWRKDFSSTTVPQGTDSNDRFTGAWEVMTVPAANIPNTQEYVSNGVPTATGGWATPGGSTLLPYSSNGTGGGTNYMNRTILVGYMTDTYYEGAVLKHSIWTP